MRRPTEAGLFQRQLDGLFSQIRFPPQAAAAIGDALELPLALQQQIQRFRDRETQWRAWRNETHVWLAEVAALVRPDALSVLVVFYNNNGIEEAAGVWSRRPGSRWRLIDAVEPRSLWLRLQSDQPEQQTEGTVHVDMPAHRVERRDLCIRKDAP